MLKSHRNAFFDAHQLFPDCRNVTTARSRPVPGPESRIRAAEVGDLAAVVAIDAGITGLEKPDYWFEIFHRYGTRGRQQRFFLVADRGAEIDGYVVGEVRDWEFGSPPCGWVFGIAVRPLPARGREQGTHAARARQPPGAVLLPQPGHDRRAGHPARARPGVSR